MTLQEVIGIRIVELCRKRKITINKLAKNADIPQSTLNNIIHGNSKKPNIVIIYKVASYFNMTLSEFFDIPILKNEIMDDLK
ncbi:MAG: helix-turn-helix transcriptional regulator [Peptococcaceae bacterium]|jgi:transcriptional regulator with XRE-family HTH domain|nr:helix-turn-helix transcriptional regulator [Peptococcaceae bacterium]